jgi:hypothetical protein
MIRHLGQGRFQAALRCPYTLFLDLPAPKIRTIVFNTQRYPHG